MRSNFIPNVPGVTWSAHAFDIDSGEVLFSHNAGRVLDLASVGKVFLLSAVAEHSVSDDLDLLEEVTVHPEDRFDNSGIWQALHQRTLPLYDICVLIGAVSDNQATNTLLRRVGREKVQQFTRALGFEHSALNDYVAWPLQPGDPRALSSGTAQELAMFMAGISRGNLISPDASRLVARWLTESVDCSMVVSAFGFDPLAHRDRDRGFSVFHKTGTTSSVRCDTGVVTTDSRGVAYAVFANWDASESDPRDEVLSEMNQAGRELRAYLESFRSLRESLPATAPRALIVMNDPDSGPRGVVELLARNGVGSRVVAGYQEPLPTSLDGYAALIMLGGGLMPDDDEKAPWLKAERSLAQQAIEGDVPTLGICLGAQILAHVSGGLVRANGPLPERGLTQIDGGEAAATDRLFADVPRPGFFMENHRDVIEVLSETAVLLASSERCTNQAFRLGSAVWGVQFHPEVPVERAFAFPRERLLADGLDPDEMFARARAHADDARKSSTALLNNFAQVVVDA